MSESQIEAIVCDVEADVYQNFDREVPSRYIGEKVFDRLRTIDQVAFVRFASVYASSKTSTTSSKSSSRSCVRIGIDRFRPADHHLAPSEGEIGSAGAAAQTSTVMANSAPWTVELENLGPMSYHLINLLQKLGRPRVLVLGDLILDRYTWESRTRQSGSPRYPVAGGTSRGTPGRSGERGQHAPWPGGRRDAGWRHRQGH